MFLDSESLGAVFIDGFKSWPSTYSAMQALLPYLRPKSLLIFQDFSWFDCYWLPLLAAFAGDGLELLMKVDNTAVFKIKDIAAVGAGLEALGPDLSTAPYVLCRDILNNYASSMYHSGDDVGFLLHTAQSYVLSYLSGQNVDAAETLSFLINATKRLRAEWLIDTLNKNSFQIHTY